MIGTYSKNVRRAATNATRVSRSFLQKRTPDWMRRAFGPMTKRADMLFIDHGIFRVVYLNYHKLDAQAARCAQPAPFQIKRMAKAGVKTIVNLRGDRQCGSYWLEDEACRTHGIKLVNFTARSRAAPRPDEIRGARDLFASIEYPMVMHCKSGADRAGIMSVLYLFLHRGVPIEEAVKQLSVKFGHFKQAETGVLDYFFESYIAANAHDPIDFWVWLDTVYDADALKAKFRSGKFADRLVNSVLRRE